MCGLFGFISVDHVSSDDLSRARLALDAVRHRGPDQFGESLSGGAFLGHRRLSILDLSESGRQPMESAAGDIAVTVNGEIYNHVDLRRELGVQRFASTSDSEVVLHGYETWGLDGLLRRLDGMFAFAIHDRRSAEVHLARDRVGIKPLHYGRVDGHWCWASELRSIVEFASTSMSIDESAVYDALTYGYVPTPKTLYRGISKLAPGHSVTLSATRNEATPTAYWRLETSSADMSRAEAVEGTRRLIGEAVEAQLMADVPVGFFLSGGIDSAAVLADGADVSKHAVAYTIGYDDATHDESGDARTIAEHLGAEHVIETLAARDSSGLLDNMQLWFDEPFADSSALPTFHVSTLARRGSVVALTGDGGDELFGGYRWYRRFGRTTSLQRRMGPLRHLVRPTSLGSGRAGTGRLARLASGINQMSRTDPLALYAQLLGDRLPSARKDRWRSHLGLAPDYEPLWHLREHDDPSLPLPVRLQALDFKTYLPDDILTKVDRTSMRVSLEARVPLLATAVIEHAFSIPPEFTEAGGTPKSVLKDAYRSRLPPDVFQRPKRGFSIPTAAWDIEGADPEASTMREAVVAGFVDPPPAVR